MKYGQKSEKPTQQKCKGCIDEIKSKLITLISHEFNTPMTSIKGGSDLALEMYNDALKEHLSLPLDNFLDVLNIIKEGYNKLVEVISDFISEN